MVRKILFRTALAFLVTCIFLQVQLGGGKEVAAAARDPRPGKVIWTSGQALASADAHMWDVGGDNQIHHKYIEGLVADAGWINYKPGLATSWKVSPDKLTWTFKLRRGVKFHSGDPLTAEDVVWSALRLRDLPAGNLKGHVKTLKKAKALDNYTVQLVFSKPNPLIIYDIFFIRVYSKRQAERDEKKFYEKFIGTGPWKFVEWKPNQYIRFERNKEWWGKFAEGAPTMIEHRPIGEESTRVAALLTGEVDVVERMPAEPMKLIDKSNLARGIRRPSSESVDICMKNDKPPFNDSKLRQAMDYLVPRESIVNDLTGQGLPGVVWSQELHPWFPKELKGKVKPFDKAKAKALIAESNYKGEEIRLITRRGRTPKDVEMCQLLGEIWKGEGLNVKVEAIADSAFSQRRKGGDYEMFMTGWGLNSPAYYYGAKYKGHKINRHKVDPKFAEMIESLTSEGDWDKFVEKTQEIERYMYKDPAALHIWRNEHFWGVSNRIQKFENVGGWTYAEYEKTVLAPSARAK